MRARAKAQIGDKPPAEGALREAARDSAWRSSPRVRGVMLDHSYQAAAVMLERAAPPHPFAGLQPAH